MRMLRIISLMLLAVNSLYGVPEKEFEHHHCDRGDISRYDNALNSKDWEELYDFVNAKRRYPISEKFPNFSIAGDIRFDWRNNSEKTYVDELGRSIYITGGKGKDSNDVKISRNDFDVVFNLYFDYQCGRTWAVAQLEFDNSAGIDYYDNGIKSDYDDDGLFGSGFCCDICLQRAYMGYNLCSNCDTSFDIEIGRRRLYHIFDSEVQFLSRFDGILLRYTSHWNCVGDFYAYLGGFLIDERSNHFGWATEIGLYDICNTGVDLKYSFIDWCKYGENRRFKRNPHGTDFMISQVTSYYHICPDMLFVPAKLYGAFLINHGGESFMAGNGEKISNDNMGWYAGVRFGDVCRRGDWGLDLQYQYVQVLAVPDPDVSGIGRGNWFDERVSAVGRGNTNYKGFRIEGLYAITDNIAVNARFEESRQIAKEYGGTHRFSQFRLETIYAF